MANELSKNDLLGKFRDESSFPYDDYVKHYLIDHWKRAGGQNKWEEVVSDRFMERHSVEGNLSKEKAVDTCRVRSNNGDRDFLSTSLDKGFLQRIVKFIGDNLIAWHGVHAKGFRNYYMEVKGYMWTVQCRQGEFSATGGEGTVVVGLDKSGLITHFHGVLSSNDLVFSERGEVWERVPNKNSWRKRPTS